MSSAACVSTRLTVSRRIAAWLDGDSHLPAYAFHKRFLQHLQHQTVTISPGTIRRMESGRGRWVVKCPDHLFALGRNPHASIRMRGWYSCIATR